VGASDTGREIRGTIARQDAGFAAFSALLIALLAVIVLSRAGLALPEFERAAGVGIWFVVGYSVLGTLMNAMSKSRWERILWIPATVLMLVSSGLVAIG